MEIKRPGSELEMRVKEDNRQLTIPHLNMINVTYVITVVHQSEDVYSHICHANNNKQAAFCVVNRDITRTRVDSCHRLGHEEMLCHLY